ncbi:MAG TPA: hypothetical protein VMZ71_02740 [Gemmataceae bacterium]|nr:hypothetical protein [Gemmataceae bacterium]
MTRFLAAALVLVAASASPAQTPPAKSKPSQAETDQLAKTLRELLLKHLPDPIVETTPGWGQQRECTVGYKFHKEGLRLRTEVVKGMRNDGAWRKFVVTSPTAAKTLGLGIKDAESPEPGKVTFTALITADCDFRFEQQLWQNGVRLYSGETRGRFKAGLILKCEATNRTEKKPGDLLPEVVFRVRATEAELHHDKITVEHTAGLGGDAARLLGDAVLALVKQVKPNLERDLLAKANAAIVKAADTKEVRLSVGSLFKMK